MFLLCDFYIIWQKIISQLKVLNSLNFKILPKNTKKCVCLSMSFSEVKTISKEQLSQTQRLLFQSTIKICKNVFRFIRMLFFFVLVEYNKGS